MSELYASHYKFKYNNQKVDHYLNASLMVTNGSITIDSFHLT
mgnify:CR=1 FL=1